MKSSAKSNLYLALSLPDISEPVNFIDINSDGLLDIYVCRSGPETDLTQKNLLYINNKDLTFTESSMSYGLSEHKSHSIQSNFFDYDNDGYGDASVDSVDCVQPVGYVKRNTE